MLYVGAFARNHHGWKPHLNLTRDDSIGGGKNHGMETIYAEVKGNLAEVFREKEDAFKSATAMRMLFEGEKSAIVAAKGEQFYAESLSGFIYLEQLANVFRLYVEGYFQYLAWKDTKDDGARVKAERLLREWQKVWQAYSRDIPKLPGTPTPYKSRTNSRTPEGGMEELCLNALAEITPDTQPAGAAQGRNDLSREAPKDLTECPHPTARP